MHERKRESSLVWKLSAVRLFVLENLVPHALLENVMLWLSFM